jgi:hypothetical protein
MQISASPTIVFFRDYALLLAAGAMLLIECGFRAAHWTAHFSNLQFWLSATVSIAFSAAIALTCIGLLLLTAKEFAEGSATPAWTGLLISVALRCYIMWENTSVSDGDAKTQVFLQVISAIVAIAEIRIALTAFASFQQQFREQYLIPQPEAKAEVVKEVKTKSKAGSRAKTDGSKNLPAESSGPEALERFENEYEMQHGRKPTRAEAAAHFFVTDRTIRTWARA